MRIYIGNLSYDVTEAEIKTQFEAFGRVDSVNVIIDRDTGRSKGFGFVEMPVANEAQAAISALNGKEIRGRNVTVNEARQRTDDRGGFREKVGSYGDRRPRR